MPGRWYGDRARCLVTWSFLPFRNEFCEVIDERAKEPGGIDPVVAAVIGRDHGREHRGHDQPTAFYGRTQAHFADRHQGDLVERDYASEPGHAGRAEV